jgi:hypothetical protein
MRKSLGLLMLLASAGLATGAVSQPAARQPLPPGLQRGPDAFVMLAGGAKGNVSPQRAGTAVVVKPLVKPYRPTVDNPRFYPCTPGTFGCTRPITNVEDHRYKPEVRDHRDGSSGPYYPRSKPQSKSGGTCPGWSYGPNGWYQSPCRPGSR